MFVGSAGFSAGFAPFTPGLASSLSTAAAGSSGSLAVATILPAGSSSQ